MSEVTANLNLSLVEWLRKIKITWELDLKQFSRIAHVQPETLEHYLAMPENEVAALPSIPLGLEQTVALISVFKKLRVIYPKLEEQNEWLRRDNQVYEGNKPIDVMAMSPEHLSWVSYTLAAVQ